MTWRFVLTLVIGLGQASVFSGCGTDSNINQFFMTQNQKDALDALMAKARIALNTGNMADARKYGEAAAKLAPESEEVMVLLGFVYTGVAGMDALSLIEKFVEIDNEDDGAKLKEGATSSAGDTLSKLSTLVGLPSDVYEGKLGTIDEGTGLFADIPVVTPTCAEDARASVASLSAVNGAIAALCPFVDAETQDATDSRHQAAGGCKPTTHRRQLQTKAHFIWAVAHLTEALAFYSAFAYSTDSGGRPNLELRATALQQTSATSTSQLTEFIEGAESFSNTIDQIFPGSTTNDCTSAGKTAQFQYILSNLDTVSKSFGRIAGMPESVTKPISDAIEKVRKASANVSSATEKALAEQQNLKSQMTKKIVKGLGTKVDEIIAGGSADPAQVEELCNAIESIAGDGSESPLPSGC